MSTLFQSCGRGLRAEEAVERNVMSLRFWAAFEKRSDFVRWLTRGATTRYCILQPTQKGGYQWAIVQAQAGIIDQSGGAFYSDMGTKVPGPGHYHPNALVAAAMGARAHAKQVRGWCRDFHAASKKVETQE
jgi:hypothetical protein